MKSILLGILTRIAGLGVGLLLLLGVLHFGLPGSESIVTIYLWVWLALSLLICNWVSQSKPWWLHALCWLVGGEALLFGSLYLMQVLEPAAVLKAGPGATVFLAPVMILFFGIGWTGGVRFFRDLTIALKRNR